MTALIIKRILTLTVAYFLISNIAVAQVCSGSLGDPVINKTFGTGRNPGAALPPGITNYPYFASACPNDGNYSIANSSYNCHGSTWHSVVEDHTPNDTAGYMMVI